MTSQPTWKVKGFTSQVYYLDFLARRKGFESYAKQREEQIKS